MALPDGITTCTVSFGGALDAIGSGGGVIRDPKVTSSDRVVWDATGDTLFEEYVPSPQNNSVSFEVPHVDQAGFIAAATGEAIVHWSYTFTCRVEVGGQKFRVSKTFQPLVGDATLDLDKIASGGALPVETVAPSGLVRSVAGLQGNVSAEDLEEALTGIAGTTDAGMTTIDADPDSAFRVQQDARLTATYVRKRSSIVNVDDYGAVGDGVADDAPAIRAAATAAGVGGIVVGTPGKTYLTRSLIVPLARQRWFGHGATIRRGNQIVTTTSTAITSGDNGKTL